jgi:hypothetical protein
MSILSATMMAIADPFVYAPIIVTSDMQDDCDLGHNTAVISGFMHASPPTQQGVASILSLDPSMNVKGSKIERSAASFLVTEIGLDFTQDEMDIPSGLAAWATQLDSLVYSNKANSNNYALIQLFSNFDKNLLTLQTKYGELAKDFFSTFRTDTNKEVLLVQN